MLPKGRIPVQRFWQRDIEERVFDSWAIQAGRGEPEFQFQEIPHLAICQDQPTDRILSFGGKRSRGRWGSAQARRSTQVQLPQKSQRPPLQRSRHRLRPHLRKISRSQVIRYQIIEQCRTFSHSSCSGLRHHCQGHLDRSCVRSLPGY